MDKGNKNGKTLEAITSLVKPSLSSVKANL